MKINQVLVESAGATVAFAFGRFNPAHQGHIEVWRTVEQAGANWFIGTNSSTIGPNDPLTFQQKSAWMEEIYPPISGHIVAEQSVLTLAAYIFKKTRKNENATVAYITDAADWAWSGKLLNQYNGVEGAHGYYKFAQIVHVPSPRVSSATALRDAARADDKVAFYHASGTDPKSKVAGLTYFDTVKQACEKYPLPVKRGQKVKEGQIDEIDRRGFLKGMGAAAVAGAAGSAMAQQKSKLDIERDRNMAIANAQPLSKYSHSSNVDPMTGKETGKYSEVRSDNSNAVLSIQWPGHKWPGVFIKIPGATINFGVYGANGRIKINGSTKNIALMKTGNGSYSMAHVDISPKSILSASGDLWIEVPIYNKGNEVFKFTLEPDNITKSGVEKTNKDEIKSKEALTKKTEQMKILFSQVIEYNNKIKQLGKYGNGLGIPYGAPRYSTHGSHILSSLGPDSIDKVNDMIEDYQTSPMKKETETEAIEFINKAKEYLNKHSSNNATSTNWAQPLPNSKIDPVKSNSNNTTRSSNRTLTPAEVEAEFDRLRNLKDSINQDVAEDNQKTVAKTWDQMTAQEKISGVKGRTLWNEKTKKYYTVFDVPATVKEDEEAGEVKKTGQLIPFPAGTTKVSVSDVYDWYKLGQVISDLDDANPADFGQGAPETVIAFGSEEEEHKLLPLLQRLGLKLKDIDQPVGEAYHAGSLYEMLKKERTKNWSLTNKRTQ